MQLLMSVGWSVHLLLEIASQDHCSMSEVNNVKEKIVSISHIASQDHCSMSEVNNVKEKIVSISQPINQR